MLILDKAQLFSVSGGGLGIDDAINIWAGYASWNYSAVITTNAIIGGAGTFLGVAVKGFPIGGLIAAPFGAFVAGVVAGVEYRVGAYIDATQKAKWADFQAAQQA